MKKFYFLFLLVLAAAFTQAQQILLYSETFENGSNDFLFDSVGPGSNTGNNNWVVNNLYTGQPQYPNTPGEDSVVSGTIFGAPNSHYLHIHDIAATGGIGNANWNTHSVSDRFCYLGSSFCTLGLTDVTLAFFWICQGDSAAGAYGQVYYSADGGPWTATGRPKYCKQSKWKYETISDPAFSNVQNLRFGFRWVNPNTNDSSTISFGLDDIIAVGTYDNVNNPVTIHTSILDTQICQGDQIIFYMALSQPMCDGDYQIQMSNASGNFSSPYNLGFLSLGAGFTAGYFASLGTPGNLSGSCFRLRVVRTGPQPVIISDTSVCFSMIHCPNLIYNVNAPVLHDADTTCIESVIDVMFNSTGVYGSSNTYTAQLSDSTGSFSNPYTLGTLHVRDSFPSTPPGNISGLIPANVPPGCGYYIRVVSNNPIATSTPVGPYCLVQCDELTNNHTDMHFCVASGPYPECDSFRIQRNTWNNQASYDTCNSWRIELRDMMTFGLVNSGGLGIFHDTAGGYYTLCMPSTPDSLPVAPGTYYMRILSNCSNEAWNETGSVIRITIGAPNTNPPVLTLGDSVVCNSGAELIEVIASPFNSP
ncbi:MAG TPA: hypothetical protein VG603_04890, partial [Chitinophagales bacterium]|nr:hypothetical protein [Chitinophagales bacterium]